MILPKEKIYKKFEKTGEPDEQNEFFNKKPPLLFSKQRLKNWAIKKAHSKNAPRVLAFVAFLESSFVPLPPDILLIPMVTLQREKWAHYATITTLSSVIGGLFGYLVGFLLFDSVGVKLIEFYGLQEQFSYVSRTFTNNSFFAVFISAFTPIPYKIFTITAGIFQTNILLFFLASFLGRGLRFYIEAYIMHHYGLQFARLVYKYLNIVFVAIFFVVVGIFIFELSR